MLCPEEDLSEGRRESVARINRAAVAIPRAVEIFHAASRCESVATPNRHLDEGVVEGLFFACRELAKLACQDVRPEWPMYCRCAAPDWARFSTCHSGRATEKT